METALTYDALMYITETINQLKSTGVTFEPREVQCDSEEPLEDDLDMIAALERVIISIM